MSELVQKEINKAIEKHEVFFAFSQKQVDEGKKEGITYVNMGGGCLCPKENVEQFINDMDEGSKIGIKNDVQTHGAKKIITREYFNHECQITNDTSDMRDALAAHIEQYPQLFTEMVIKETVIECFNEAVEKDWF